MFFNLFIFIIFILFPITNKTDSYKQRIITVVEFIYLKVISVTLTRSYYMRFPISDRNSFSEAVGMSHPVSLQLYKLLSAYPSLPYILPFTNPCRHSVSMKSCLSVSLSYKQQEPQASGCTSNKCCSTGVTACLHFRWLDDS